MDPWIKSAEDFLWTSEILMTMGRYAQAFLLACHAYNLCMRGSAPFEKSPPECKELIFPKDGKTPEDLIGDELAQEMIARVKECLGL